MNRKFSLFPNPTTNFVYLNGGKKDEWLSLSIADAQGRIVLTTTLLSKGTFDRMELNLVNGVYVVYIQTPHNGTVIKKLVINH